jgi:hypothetical protein
MAAQQLHLFPAARPLAERFGMDFFRSVPESPGVYFFCGVDEGVLYVGKARNLRRRLGSYRSALPERLPRKLRRLMNLVSRIHWDECRDEAAAMERERELLLTLKPRFNTVGTYPSPKVHLGWQQTDRGLWLGCSEEKLTLIAHESTRPLPHPSGILLRNRSAELLLGSMKKGRFAPSGSAALQCFGPVSGGRFLHGAILRLLWWTLHPALGWEGMPKALHPIKPLPGWEFAGDPADAEEISRRLNEFFQGTSPELAEWFVASAAWRPSFERAWIGRDALLLFEYFERLTGDVVPVLH